MKNDKLILMLLLAGGAWYLYTRSQGLTLTGQPQYPLITQGNWNPQSTITPSGSTSVQATNVFSAIASGIQTIIRSIAQPGNAPIAPSPSYAISGGQAVGAPAANYGVPSVGDPMPAYDPTLEDSNPFWMWDNSFERPANGTVQGLEWTLNGPVDYSYIPPPPGE